MGDVIIYGMKTITTYSARRTSVFVWLAVLSCLVAAVSRVVFFASAGTSSLGMAFVRIILPIAANLFIAIRLPLNGEKRFYVTIFPMFLYFIYFISCVTGLLTSKLLTAAVIFVLFAWYVVYAQTYKGRISSALPVLVLSAVLCALIWRSDYGRQTPALSDSMVMLSVVLVILSGRRLPPPAEGEAYRMRYGDRSDGRLVRNNTPINKLNPYFMPTRIGASNYITDKFEVSAIERYIRQKRKEGLKHFGITHVILAAYVRCCAELPALNRFLSGQKIFHRYDIVINMAIKKEMAVDGAETIIKIHFDPKDTADDVYRKYDEVLQSVRTPSLDSNFDKLAACIDLIPGLVRKFAIWLLKVLDYFGWLPYALMDLSPFHGSMFITSMGSLGIPPIYHHLYDFGNVPVFCAFGCKRTEYEMDASGKVEAKKYVDYSWVCDERIIDGFYYASVLKRMRSLLSHPERLDEAHEVVEDIL